MKLIPGSASIFQTLHLLPFADVANVVSLFKMAGALQSQVSVRYPRDLTMRDLDHNNCIFLGSPGSNPWVTLLQDKLNFPRE